MGVEVDHGRHSLDQSRWTIASGSPRR
jgi:hypothetical protein